MNKVVIIFCLSLAVSFSAFFFAKGWEEGKRQQEFSIRAQGHTSAIRAGLEEIAKQQEDMRFLIEFNSNDNTGQQKSPEDFMYMLSPIITHEPSIIDIHWGILNENNSVQLAYSWTDTDNTEKHHISPTLQPVTAYIKKDSILELVSPITNTVNNIEENTPLSGTAIAWLISEWDIPTLVEQALKHAPVSAQDFNIRTVNQGKFESIYFHPSRSRTDEESDIHTNITATNTFSFMGLDIQVEYEAAPKFLRDFPIILAWQTLIMWLVVSVLLAWYLYKREKNRLKLRRIIDDLQDVYYQMDMSGKIQSISPSIQALGYQQDDVTGSKISNYFSKPEEFKTLLHSLQESKAGKLQNHHIQFKHQNGTPLWISLNAKYIYNHKKQAIGIEGTLNDFTRIKEHQEKIQHADKLENLGAMAGGIAHNFNNILAVVIGNVSLARLNAQDTDKLDNHLIEIEKASEKAAIICKQMLAYSEQSNHVSKSLNINQTIQSLSEMIHASFSNLAEIQFNLQADLPNIHNADPTLIRQLVIDLVHNAAESYGENQGDVIVQTGIEYLSKPDINRCTGATSHNAGSYIFIRVSDQGCGIPESKQSQVFDPFFSTKFVGRGLGLSSTLGVVQSHKAMILLESQENIGTTMTVFFPIDNNIT